MLGHFCLLKINLKPNFFFHNWSLWSGTYSHLCNYIVMFILGPTEATLLECKLIFIKD
jgi:hypothetical protein